MDFINLAIRWNLKVFGLGFDFNVNFNLIVLLEFIVCNLLIYMLKLYKEFIMIFIDISTKNGYDLKQYCLIFILHYYLIWKSHLNLENTFLHIEIKF